MMMKQFIAACAIAVATLTQVVSAQELTIGSKAPKLELKEFIKGEEVKGFEKGKIYVIELWATWCGPCRVTIPHLTELQKKFEDVAIIGVAVLEEDQAAVADFVKEMGDKMDYRVALDLVPEDAEPTEGKIVTNWMQPAEQQGIPAAFIINGDGKVAWIGHPGQMEEPLEKIVAGTWDLEAEAQKLADMKALQKKLTATIGRLQELFKEFSDDGDPKDLLAELDTASEEIPDRAEMFNLIRFQVLALSTERSDEAVDVGNKIIETEQGEDPGLLSNMARVIVDPNRDHKASPKLLKFALKLAQKADKLVDGEDVMVADTLAKAYFDTGDVAEAVKAQERAIELAEGTRAAADPSLKKRLRQYKKALDSANEKEEKPAEKPKK
ncbi:redoxin domain-containing protein [Schlesneria sp. T3-172]|uniref:redoxin domain-containing protein n=1 Tax=Schlesneria sphaerica TaxID=3373610 RepID=UPI0037C7B7C3